MVINNIAFITDVDQVRNDWVGGFSQKEMKIIQRYASPPILHLFSGASTFGDTRIDCNPTAPATIHGDVFKHLHECKRGYNTIILDPIYCSEHRQDAWKAKYGGKEELYVFPYDTRRTAALQRALSTSGALTIIIKSLSFYTWPNYRLLQGFVIYPGAYKPARTIAILRKNNHALIPPYSPPNYRQKIPKNQ